MKMKEIIILGIVFILGILLFTATYKPNIYIDSENVNYEEFKGDKGDKGDKGEDGAGGLKLVKTLTGTFIYDSVEEISVIDFGDLELHENKQYMLTGYAYYPLNDAYIAFPFMNYLYKPYYQFGMFMFVLFQQFPIWIINENYKLKVFLDGDFPIPITLYIYEVN